MRSSGQSLRAALSEYVLVSVTRSSFDKLRRAYEGLCERWIADDAGEVRAGSHARAAQLRFFKLLFAFPLFGALSVGLSALGGLSMTGAFLAMMAVFAFTLVSAGLVRTAGGTWTGLILLAIGGALLGAGLTAHAGYAAALPLALAAGGETLYLTRRWPHAALTAFAAGALSLALSHSVPAASGWMVTLCGAAALIHMISLWPRGFSEAPSKPASLAEAVAAEESRLLLRMEMNGQVSRIEGESAALLGVSAKSLMGFGLYERLLIGDRLAYLGAIDDMRTGKRRAEAFVRLRADGKGGAYQRARIVFCELDASAIAAAVTPLSAEPETAEAEPGGSFDSMVKADRYLANVSHELRTPLNAILGFSDILQQEMFGALANDRQREYVGLIHQSGVHLLSVVNMILDMSKLDTGAYAILAEPFDVSEALSVSLSMVRGQAEAKGITLTRTETDDAGECVGDRRAFQQILINLLSNAVKFTPEGGSVSVEAALENGCLAVSITDTGIGISPLDLERIGQPFFQVQNDYTRAFEGTGLGLSLVRGLVKLHDGGLSVESELGAGTKVTVRLPIKGPHGAAKARLIDLNKRREHTAAAQPRSAETEVTGVRDGTAIRKTA